MVVIRWALCAHDQSKQVSFKDIIVMTHNIHVFNFKKFSEEVGGLFYIANYYIETCL